MGFWDAIKQRWELKNTLQFVLIITVFAVTGTTSMHVGSALMHGIDALFALPDVLRWFVKFLLIFLIYPVLLLAFGFVFGQFSFFKKFLLKTWHRLFGNKSKVSKRIGYVFICANMHLF